MKENLQILIDDWYNRGFNGAFPSGWGKGVFHSIDNLRKIGTNNYMFNIDFGSADIEKSLQALNDELEIYGCIVERTYENSVHDTILIKKI